MKEPMVSIVIVMYNGEPFIGDCLRAVMNSSPNTKRQVIVVDNGSADRSCALVEEQFPDVMLIRSSKNNYCYANNIGAQAATGDFIAFLNQDVAVDPQWFDMMLAAFRAEKKTGIVGGKILFPDGRIQSAGHTRERGYEWHDRGFRKKDMKQYNMAGPAESVSGAAVMYARKCFEALGGFDEDFILLLEDVDMAVRARAAGWNIMYVPRARAIHRYHSVMTETQEQYFSVRNKWLLIAKHWPQHVCTVIEDDMRRASPSVTLLRKSDPLIGATVLAKLVAHRADKNTLRLLPAFVDIMQRYFPENKQLIQHFDKTKSELLAATDSLQQRERYIADIENELGERETLFKKIIHDLQQSVTRQNDALCRIRIELEQKQAEEERQRQELAHANTQLREERDRINDAVTRAEEMVKEQWAGRQQELERALAEKERLLHEKEAMVRAATDAMDYERIQLKNEIKNRDETLREQELLLDEAERNRRREKMLLEEELVVRERRIQEYEELFAKSEKQYEEKLWHAAEELVAGNQKLKEQNDLLLQQDANYQHECQTLKGEISSRDRQLKEQEELLAQAAADMNREVALRDEQLLAAHRAQAALQEDAARQAATAAEEKRRSEATIQEQSLRINSLEEESRILKDDLAIQARHNERHAVVIKEKDEQLGKKEQQLAQQQELFEKTTADMNRIIAAKDELLNKAIADMNHMIQAKDEQLGKKEEQLAQQQELVNKTTADMNQIIVSKEEMLSRTIADMNHMIQAKDEQISKQMYLAANTFQMIQEMRIKEQEYHEKTIELHTANERLRIELTGLDKELAQREEQLQTHMAAAQQAKESLEQKVFLIEEQTRVLREKEEEIKRIHSEYDQQIGQRDEQILLQTETIHLKESELGAREQLVRLKDTELAEHRTALETMQQQLAAERDALSHEIECLKQQLAELSTNIRGIQNERDWLAHEKSTLNEKYGMALQEKEALYQQMTTDMNALLKAKDDKLYNLEQLITFKEHQIYTTEQELEEARRHIDAFYNSRGYKFILKPALTITQPIMRPFKRQRQ